jgi:energy-coupling factor transporter transmembrane protein EcfT
MESELQPSTRIALWIMLAVGLYGMQRPGLALLTATVAGLVVMTGSTRDVWKGLFRARILLLAMFLIYAFTTPGDSLWLPAGRYSPSKDGIQSGTIQAWRLAIMLASLAVLLTSCSRQALLGGIYHLLKPLASLGINPERIAVRIWLTLYYAENMPPFKISKNIFASLSQRLADVSMEAPVAPQEIEIEATRLGAIDWSVLLAAFSLMCWSLW